MSLSRRGTMTEVAQELAKSRMAGTWALPKNEGDVRKIVYYLRRMELGEHPTGRGEDIQDLFYHMIGDDDLFDDLGRYDRVKESDSRGYFKSCADVINNHIADMTSPKSLEGIIDPKQREMMERLIIRLRKH